MLVMVVDGPHRLHARIVRARHLGLVPVAASLLLEPIIDAAHERGN
ncbi:hypothetical protein SDC9_80827 [bioreactor metagenome]|uniref:Uncharacterized protein n=1 Tax=bioreactor metagenome TaxID=1076179 RepID=A0A644Z029_9ZZZZ